MPWCIQSILQRRMPEDGRGHIGRRLEARHDVVSIISSAVSSESSTAMLDSAEKSTEEKDRVKKRRPSPCGITVSLEYQGYCFLLNLPNDLVLTL